MASLDDESIEDETGAAADDNASPERGEEHQTKANKKKSGDKEKPDSIEEAVEASTDL